MSDAAPGAPASAPDAHPDHRTDPARDPRLDALAGAAAMACAMGIGRFAYTPVLPHMQSDAGLTIAAAGYVAAANFLGYLAGALLASLPVFVNRRGLWLRSALATSVLTTGAMAWLHDPWAWAIVRLLSGVSSAFVLVLMSGLVLERLAAAGRPRWSAAPFTGVGIGIAISALVVDLATRTGSASATMWTMLALVAAAFGFAPWLRLTGEAPRQGATAAARSTPLPPMRRRAMTWLAACYGCVGFGYVITATFLVLMVRGLGQGQGAETTTWMLTGLAAIPSNLLWLALAQRIGNFTALWLAYLVEAVGVVLAACAGGMTGVLLGAAMLGSTFMAITVLAFAAARDIVPHPGSRVFAMLTVWFSVGQMIGPAVAGAMAERIGGFVWPSLLAAAVLCIGGWAGWRAGRCNRLAAGGSAPRAAA